MVARAIFYSTYRPIILERIVPHWHHLWRRLTEQASCFHSWPYVAWLIWKPFDRGCQWLRRELIATRYNVNVQCSCGMIECTDERNAQFWTWTAVPYRVMVGSSDPTTAAIEGVREPGPGCKQSAPKTIVCFDARTPREGVSKIELTPPSLTFILSDKLA